MEWMEKNSATIEFEASVARERMIGSTSKISMDQLKDEFRNILMMITTHTNPIETNVDTLINSSNHSSSFTEIDALITPNSSTHSSFGTESSAGFKTARESINEGYLEYEDEDEDEVSHGTSYHSTNSIFQIGLIPSEAIYEIRGIVERMITAGFQNECIEVYVSVRKPVVAASIHRIWIEKLNIGDIQGLEWDALEAKIRRWIRVSKVCVRILLARERRVCEKIFEGEGLCAAANDACFMETVKGPTIQLFNVSEMISTINPRPTEKLFKILDLLNTLFDLLSNVIAVFGSNLSEPIQVQGVKIISSLAETARETLLNFASVVLHDRSTTPEPGGRIHPLTRCVMNYIIFISDYRISDYPTIPDINFPDPEDQSLLAVHLLLVISHLQLKLKEKSMYYKDASLSNIFLMNNLHYIVQKVKGSPELSKMFGYDVIMRKLTPRFQQEAASYEKLAWDRILYCLRDKESHVRWRFSSGVSKSTLGKRLKTFNSKFEEAHRVQGTWSVPDPQLREELQMSISEKLIPAYRSFLDRFRSRIEDGEHPERYIKYSVEDLELAVLDFFAGRPISLHTSNRSQ